MDTEISLARKFEILIDEAVAPDGRSHTLTELSGVTGLTLNSLSRLKTGRVEDPRLSTLLLITDFFGVSLDYFKCRTEDECYEFLQDELRRRSTVPEIATRVRAMSDDVVSEIEKMVDYIRILESRQPELPDDDGFDE